MAFRDDLKKYRESQGKQTTTSTTPKTTQTSTPGSSGGGGTGSFRDWLKEYREVAPTISLDGWAESSANLINDVRLNSGSWYDNNEYQSRYDRFTSLLGQADSWRKKYAGNKEAVSYIDSVVSALSDAQTYSFNHRKYYSQWNTADDYKKYQKEQKDYEDLLNFDLEAGEKEIKDLEALLEEYDFLIPRQDVQNPNSEYNVRLREIRQQYGSKEDIKNLISEKNAYLNRAKYHQDGVALSGVTGNADFNMHSGYVSTKTDGGWWDEVRSTYGMGYDDLTYEYINGADNGMREEISRKAISYSSEVDPEQATTEWNIYDHMTDDEISIYNYHYSKEGKEAAQKYLDSIRKALEERKATGKFENYEDNTAMELLFGVEAGVDQFKTGVKNLFNFKDNYIPASSTQILSGMVREDLKDNGPVLPDWLGGSSVGQAAYDTITTTANMAPSVLTSMVVGAINPVAGEVVGSSLMGASAAGNAYQEALNLGYNKGQARAYSTIIGASEAGLQYLLGGIGSMGGKASGEALSKMLSGIDNAFLRTAIKFGGNMLSEGFEEGLQEILTPLFKDWTLRAEEDVNWSEVAYSGLLGALTAGFMEGPTTIAGEVNTYRTGKQLQAADISAARLAEIGKTFSADTVAYQLAGKVNENTDAYTLGRLFNEIGATLSEQNVSEITEALVAKGMDRKTAQKNAKALALVVEGGELSDRQAAAIEANDVLAEAARTTLIDTNTTWNQRTQGYNAALKALADNVANQKESQTEQSRPVTENAPAADNGDTHGEIGAESRYEVAADGKTVRKSDGEVINIKGIASIEKGKMVLDTDSGTVDANDVKYASNDEALVYEAVADLGHMIDVDTANRLVQNFNKADGVSALAYARGAAQAYTYGYYGYSRAEAARSNTMSSVLTDAQRNAAYTLGRLYRGKETAQKQKVVSEKKGSPEKKQGQVFFRKDNMETRSLRDYMKESGRVLEAVQETAIKTMEKLSAALGVDFYVYESYVKDGKRYYIDENGVEQEDAPNGWYDPKTGNIYIDLNAGNTGKGTMLFTVAHELTHFIRQWSPAKFKKLADFVFKHSGFKNRGAELVEAKMAKAEERGKPISYDTAYEEVVADGMESILTSGKVVEMMADIKRQDQGLWQKICDWFKNLADDLRAVVNAYRGYSPDSTEGQMVADMKSVIKQIEAIYTEGLVDASENFQTAEKNTTNDSGVKYSLVVKRTNGEQQLVDPMTVTREDILNYLVLSHRGLLEENCYFPVRLHTPGKVIATLRAAGIKVEDRPLAMQAKKAKQAQKTGSPTVKDGYVIRKHSMSPDEIMEVIDKLEEPETIIHETEREKRKTVDGETEIVPLPDAFVVFVTLDSGKECVAVLEFDSEIDPNYIVKDGHGDEYHTTITVFEPDVSRKGRPFDYQDFLVMKDTNYELEIKEESSETESASGEMLTTEPAKELSNDMVTQPEGKVKNESAESLDVALDAKSESAAPAVLKSERTWSESDYVQEREKAAKEIATAIGVSVKKAKAYIDSVNSIAKMIADDRVRLDYFSSPGRSSFVSNVEYGGSFDFSTLCKKRRLLTGTFTAIQKALPNTALTANEILDIRNRMKEKGLEVSCGLCYVEGSRANMGQFAKEFLKLYKQYYPDAWQPNMADVNTPDGIEWVRINHPECYEQYEYFWNHYGTLNPGDKNLFASQQKPKLYQLHTEYKGEILSKFNDDDNVDEKNLNGGIRLQSFSDFEIVHLIDTMQIIMDMSRVGLAGQAYTKVPDFAWALGDTGLKINLSLIAKGVDESGSLIFDNVEGMPIDTAMALRDRYSKNVGTILVAFNDEQLLAAMADERVDFIIPFHRSQWKKSQYGAMGLPVKTKDYTYMQNEKFIKPQYHEYRGRMVRDKATNYMPNEYWDFSKSGKENAEAYLEMCARNNKRPKFYKLLQNNGDGSYSLKADGTTDGYWKLLIDFKMYDNKGNGSPQMPVKPEFNMDEATRMLNNYKGGHSNFPVAQGVVDDFVKEYKANHQVVKYSDRDVDYMAAVRRGDIETAQKMVNEAANERFLKSQIRDYDGNLLVVFHATEADFTVFDRKRINGWNSFGSGFYFTPNISLAKDYGSKVGAYFLNIKNPVDYYAIDKVLWVDMLERSGYEYDKEFVENYDEEALWDADLIDDFFGGALNGVNLYDAFADIVQKAGYDGIIAGDEIVAFNSNQVKSADPVTYDDSGNAIPLSQRFNAENDDIRYQDRDTDSVSNRSLLANALESVAQNEVEKQKLQEYKEKIEAISTEEAKLRKLNDQIKELSFAKGPRDMKKIRSLQDEATKTANRISTHDKVLLRLEAAKPLRDILLREKKAAYKKAEQKGRDAMVARRDRTTRTTAIHKVQKVVNELNDLLLNESKNRHVPDNMKKAVAAALDIVNMDTVSAEERAAKYDALIAKETDPEKIDAYTITRDNILRQGEKLGKRLQELHNAYEEIQESDDPDIANAYDPVIAGAIKELSQTIGNTSIGKMSVDQLSDVYDVYRMVLTRVRDANKALLDNIKETIGNLASSVIGEVKAAGGENTHRAAVLDPVRKFLWNNLKPVYAMEWIGSSTLTKVFNNVRAGEDVWAKDVVEARKFYLDKSKKFGYDSWDFKKKYRFESTSGIEFDLTLEQILSLYAYSKREQAHDHLRLGGFVFDSNIETYKDKGSKLIKYKVNTADAHQISPDILGEITGKLTKEQIAFVDEMQEYLSSVMGAKGNEVTSKMYGVKLFKEKFYFPLKSAKQFMFEQNEVSGEVKIKNSGFTNKVVAKANNPVILSNFMDVWAGHINDMSMYHAFTLPLEDFNRVFNYNSPKKEGHNEVSVKGTIQSAYSPAAVHYVKNLITDLNGGAMADPRETFAKAMIAKFKKAKVFSSMSVVIQQPSAIGRAYALVDPKYFRPTKDGMNHNQLWAELKQYAPVAVIKEMGYFDTNMGRSTLEFIKAKEYTTFKEKATAFIADEGYRDEKLSRLPALADELTWCAIWNAVKRETVAKHKDLRPGSEEFLNEAGKRFTEVVTKTQVYDSVLARSANMRSKSGLMSMVTSFMAEPTTSINMLEDAIIKSKRGNKGYAARAFASVGVSIILNNALASLVYAGRDDDEDETFLEKYVQAIVSGMLDDLNPVTYYPYLKDMWSLFQGYDIERADMSLISDLADSTKRLVQAYVSDDGDVAGAWMDLAGTFANLAGIPMENIRREIKGGINFVKTLIEDVNGRSTTRRSLVDTLQATIKDATPVLGWLPGETKSDKLYDAIIGGDIAYVNRIKGSYKDDDAYHSAVRKALRDNDPRIKEAAIAGYNGDPSERVRIAKLIIKDGFAQDDVVVAINAEINAIKPSEGSESKKKGLYTAEDFAAEIANGDQAAAYAAREDIIATAKKNGKTEEEAEQSFNSSASTTCKELFMAGQLTEEDAVDALVSFCGVEQDDAEERVGEWAFERDRGFSYDELKQRFLDGDISASDVKSIVMEVEGKTEAEAKTRVVTYSREAYEDGYINRTEAASVMTTYGGLTRSEAESKLRYIDVKLQFPDTYVDDAWVDEYYSEIQSSGISINVFVDYRNKVKGVTGEGKKERRMEIIDSMPISDAQKDALYYAEGWAASKIWEAPWC